ncbi:MAG: CoB--CoM heterodisulfide reductase iron-sulfur subunit B family protein [Candidatus Syntropharchaeia archaeon]
MKKFSYYPGCPSTTHAIDQELSTKAVFEKLEIELIEMEDWNCCGALEAEDPMLVYALNARNLAIAEKDGLDIATPCSICFYNLERTNEALKDEKLRAKMREIDASLDYKGNVKARHTLDIIVNEIGLEELSKKIEKKVNVKVAPYYGCYIGRPSRLGFDDPDDPESMDKLIELIGGEVIPFAPMKTKCCGGPLMMTRSDIAFEMTRKILEAAKEKGADCVITACPLCHMMLDAKQPDIEESLNIKLEIPVLYFVQLLGLALGIPAKKLAIDKNIVDAKSIVEKVV